MSLANSVITRPVLTTVCSLLIVIAGLSGLGVVAGWRWSGSW